MNKDVIALMSNQNKHSKESMYEHIKHEIFDKDNQHNLGLFIGCMGGALATQIATGMGITHMMENGRGTWTEKRNMAMFLSAYSNLFMLPPAFVAKSYFDKNVKSKKK
jgi:hypothetical protein